MKVLDLDWATASRPAARGGELGDGVLVKPVEHGILIAVVDGLGHGPEAASAMRHALRVIEQSTRATLEGVCEECHRALQPSRGVVLGLATVDSGAGVLSWLGVGGVNALILRSEPDAGRQLHALVTQKGVIGRRLPVLRPVQRPLAAGDLLIFATDGVRPDLDPAELADDAPDRVAARILERHAVSDDDALVLVASYRGGRS